MWQLLGDGGSGLNWASTYIRTFSELWLAKSYFLFGTENREGKFKKINCRCLRTRMENG